MRREYGINAYAKINLFLEVTAKREDGYHVLDTVMQSVSLCDRVAVRYDPDGAGIEVRSSKKNIPTGEANIAYRCAELFLRESGKSGSVYIKIDKKIPVAAGLGGGSADGAAALNALNKLTGSPFSTDELCALGARLGADIPFCIRCGCMKATGIGDVFEPAEGLKGLFPVIAIGSGGSQTPAAYKALDEAGYAGCKDSGRILDALRRHDNDGVCAELYNAFEEVVIKSDPQIGTLKGMMSDLGAKGTLMSGSGASVFGLFDSPLSASRASEILRKKKFFAAAVSAVSKPSQSAANKD